jgi:hypothetical protein
VPVLPVQSVFRSTEIVEFWKKFLLELSFGVELPWCRPFVLSLSCCQERETRVRSPCGCALWQLDCERMEWMAKKAEEGDTPDCTCLLPCIQRTVGALAGFVFGLVLPTCGVSLTSIVGHRD